MHMAHMLPPGTHHHTRLIAALACILWCRPQVLADRPGTGPTFAYEHIAACMSKVVCLDLEQTLQVGEPQRVCLPAHCKQAEHPVCAPSERSRFEAGQCR